MATDFDLGRHEAQIEDLGRRMGGLEASVAGIDRKLDQVLTRMAETRGAQRATKMIAGGIGAATAAIVTLLVEIFKR